MSLKVLLQSRSTLFSVPGGDTIQILKTKEALESRGLFVNISTKLYPDLTSYDVVHLFNIIRPQEIYCQALNAKKFHKKIVLTPIYVNYDEYEVLGRHGLLRFLSRFLTQDKREYLKVFARAIINKEFDMGTVQVLLRGYRHLQKEILNLIDVLLPNSISEIKRIKSDFDWSSNNYNVVPNAIDQRLFIPTSRINKQMIDCNDCVLCVARIEGLKNQLKLIEALHDENLKIVLIGNVAPNHKSYLKKISKFIGPKLKIISFVPHDELPGYYSAAKIHVLPSWFETTGLSSLEAAAMGCNVVVSDRGDTKDYFQQFAYYCNPVSADSIRRAVLEAFNTPRTNLLRQHIITNYTWDIVGQKLYDAYQGIL